MSSSIVKKISICIRDFQRKKSQNLNSLLLEAFKNEYNVSPPKSFLGTSNIFIAYSDSDPGSDNKTDAEFNDLQRSIRVLNSDGREVSLSSLIQFYIRESFPKYTLHCKVKNRGDLVVPAAKVEFYISKDVYNPKIRISLRNKQKVKNEGLKVNYFDFVGSTSCWLNPGDIKDVSIDLPLEYFRLVPAGEARYVAVRIFSFSPEDLPNSADHFKIYSDKHIGFRKY